MQTNCCQAAPSAISQNWVTAATATRETHRCPDSQAPVGATQESDRYDGGENALVSALMQALQQAGLVPSAHSPAETPPATPATDAAPVTTTTPAATTPAPVTEVSPRQLRHDVRHLIHALFHAIGDASSSAPAASTAPTTTTAPAATTDAATATSAVANTDSSAPQTSSVQSPVQVSAPASLYRASHAHRSNFAKGLTQLIDLVKNNKTPKSLLEAFTKFLNDVQGQSADTNGSKAPISAETAQKVLLNFLQNLQQKLGDDPAKTTSASTSSDTPQLISVRA
jgi:hypothetical protein